jgi:hypothetical protein
VNHPQALPKFLISSFVKKRDTGLVQQFLIPASTTFQIRGGSASVVCDTKYPFGQTLQYTIVSSSSWDFFIRIPGWATPASTIHDGKTTKPLLPDTDGLYRVEVSPGTSHLTVTLDMEVRVVTRANNTVAIYRGPLLYALDIEYNVTSSPALNWTDRLPLPTNETFPNVHDHQYLPVSTATWAIGIDPSKIEVHDESAGEQILANPIFTRGGPPIYIEVAASQVVWAEDHGTAAIPPTTLELVGEYCTIGTLRKCKAAYGTVSYH